MLSIFRIRALSSLFVVLIIFSMMLLPLQTVAGPPTVFLPFLSQSCNPNEIHCALQTYRYWITFAPPRPFNPNTATYPSQEQLRDTLEQLYAEGWRGLVTYSMDGVLANVPRLAKETGFTFVIAGLFWFDDQQLARERDAAIQQAAWIDAFVLGNEGLQFQRYNRTALEQEIVALKTATGSPVATTEPIGQYLADSTLLEVGDWVFPTIHPWYANIRTIPDAVSYVKSNVQTLHAQTSKVVVVKEAWWPTGGGDPAASENNQNEFFRQLSLTGVRFIWGEAYDQYWKVESPPLDPGPHWGFHTDYGMEKSIINALKNIYSEKY